jgi:hypothetical protein
VKWNFMAILLCIFLITKDIEHFSYIYWPFVFLLSRSVCLDHLLNCWLNYLLEGVVLYIFWILIICQMTRWQWFPPIL